MLFSLPEQYKVILYGPQGSGKGTQADLLSATLGIPAFSMGQILREEIEKKTEIGLKIAPVVERGALIDPEESIEILRHRLAGDDVKRGYILDGFPRDKAQARLFDFDRPTHLLILHVPYEVCLERIKYRLTSRKTGKVYSAKDGFNAGDIGPDGGELFIRKDDVPEAIERRLKIYQTETFAVIDEYVRAGVPIHHIDGVGSVQEVHKRLLNAIEEVCYVPEKNNRRD